MAFQPPFCGVAAVVDEEHGQHFMVGHRADELRMVADFHEIVRCWSSSAGKAERNLHDRRYKLVADFSREVLHDGRFVRNDAAELRKVEFVQLLVVGDVESLLHIRHVGADFACEAEFRCLVA